MPILRNFSVIRALGAALFVLGLLSLGAALYVATLPSAEAADINFKGELSDVDFSTTADITTDDLVTNVNVDRITFLVHSTKAGNAQVKYVNLDGDVVNYESAVAVSANTLQPIVVNHALLRSRVVFTPGSAAPGDHFWAEGFTAIQGGGIR